MKSCVKRINNFLLYLQKFEEAEFRYPQDIRLFNTNSSVNEFNNKLFNASADRITSIAKYVYIGCTSKEQETFVRQKLHKMSLVDTNGLPYQSVYVNNIYYMITTNIDLTDGLANDVVGKLVHIETKNGKLVYAILLEFPVLPQTVEKLRRKKTISPYLYKITE
ncbi:ATP-dependent DNA helicase [Trichonephila clavipes]|nr:ATP-dependent DNA helicase [Trichonephila clavipes]